ncbi:MAG: ABC transporter permease subunit [Acidobacteria bacterium]|nr:ABC transporter permease subunit [Acidobacteriota bacterium]
MKRDNGTNGTERNKRKKSGFPFVSFRSVCSVISLQWAAGTVTAILALLPVALLGLWSIARGWYWPALLPREWSARAWGYVFAPESGIASALAMSAGIALAVTVLSLAVALPAARALALHEFSGKRLLLFALLLPVIAPPLASAMGVHALYLRYGLADTMAGVILVHLIPAAPYATLMLAGSFARFDTDYEAQARTLGASPLAVWRSVTLPAIAPGLAVAASFAFLISWSQYLTTVFIGGGRIVTLPLVLVAFQRGGDEAITAALSLVFLAPTLVVFATVARFLRQQH